jgi:hypothetical protein
MEGRIIMALRNFLENINSLEDWGGISNAGLINIETGQLAVGGKWFKQCACNIYSSSELQFECKECGRSKKNSWQCPSGYGDGIYSIVSFINKKGETIAAAVYLDDNSSLAQEFIQKIDVGEIREFNSLETIFSRDFVGIEAGHLILNFQQCALRIGFQVEFRYLCSLRIHLKIQQRKLQFDLVQTKVTLMVVWKAQFVQE